LLAVSTCGGKAASLYRAFKDRTQRIFGSYDEFKSTVLSRLMAFICIGNVPGGGDIAYHMIA
jgi:hypothetical protein